MNGIIGRAILLAVSFTLLIGAPVWAKDLKASLAQMPLYAESTDKGVLVDLTKAMAEASGTNIEIQVVPFKRSMENVINRNVDFHMPLIKNPNISDDKLDYDNSTETIFHVNFVLYSKKDKDIDLNNLKDYKLETDLAHIPYFDFPIKTFSSPDSALQKIAKGRIDGLIFADGAIDPVLKQLDLKDIKRQLYKVFDVKVILPKGEQGKDVDQFLSSTIKKLRDSGKYEEIMKAVDYEYDNWQP